MGFPLWKYVAGNADNVGKHIPCFPKSTCWKVSVPTCIWMFFNRFLLIFSCSFFGLSCFCVGVGCGSNHAVHVVLCRWGGSIFFCGNIVCGIICARGETNVFRLESACLTGWHMFLCQFFWAHFFRWNIAKRLSPKWNWDSTKMSRNSGSACGRRPAVTVFCIACKSPRLVPSIWSTRRWEAQEVPDLWEGIKRTMYVTATSH